MNLTIPYGKIPKVLLIGNGINRAFDFSSWSELLKKLSDNREVPLNGVPAPLQAVILTGDNVDKKLNEKLKKKPSAIVNRRNARRKKQPIKKNFAGFKKKTNEESKKSKNFLAATVEGNNFDIDALPDDLLTEEV